MFRLRSSVLFAGLVAVSVSAACGSPPDVSPKVPPGAKSSGGKHAVIETDQGSIELTFLEGDAPRAVENFRLLAEHNYYEGLMFHRIIRWQRAIPQYHLGHLERLAWIGERLRQHAGLFVAGNAYHGVAMNDCTEQAEVLARQIGEYLDGRIALQLEA